MPIGKKVRGYGLLNEYGEFEFVPEQTGTRQGRVKTVCEGSNYTVCTTNNSLIVHIRLKKQNGLSLLRNFLLVSDSVINVLRRYEF